MGCGVCARLTELRGPWRLEKSRERTTICYEIIDADGSTVAECWHRTLGKALASAPDLINACKSALDHLQGGDTTHDEAILLLRATLRAAGAAEDVRRAS